MNNSNRFRISASALLLALLFAAALPITALADEGEPPIPTPTETTPPAGGSPEADGQQGSESEAAPSDGGQGDVAEAAPTEVADPTLDQATVVEEAPEDQPVGSEPVDGESIETTTSTLSDIPVGTEVVVLDEAGNPVSLASSEAADVLLTGDPIWCPVGVAPIALTGGCSNTFATLQLLLASGYVPTTNSVIWIKEGTDTSAVPLIINGGTTYAAAAGFTLTLKGAWNGVSGSTTITSTPSTFSQPLSIVSWQNDVTLSDITIDAINVTGLTISTTKNIVLTRVNSINNTGASGRGASLDNSGGTGSVTVTSSNFNGNGSQGGLTVVSKGSITLASVQASSNAGLGASLNNSTAALAQNVTLTGTNQFVSNSIGGLSILSKGTVSLTGVTAVSNSGSLGTSISNLAGTMGVTISNSNFSSNTSTGGLFVNSNGSITLSGVTSSSNPSGYGAFLDNDAGTGAITISNSFFNGNVSILGGLWVQSKGAITLSSVQAQLNTGSGPGVTLDASAGVGAVTISNSHFDLNGSGGGLTVYAKGAITLSSVTVIDNPSGGIGALLNNTAVGLGTGNISVTSSSFNTNASTGLQAYSNGTITLTSVTANGNTGYGAYLENDSAVGKAVTIAGTNNQFNTNTSTGLVVITAGNVSISNVTVSSNSIGGASLDADAGSGAVTVTIGTFSQNSSFGGLYVTALGNITLSTVTANQNTAGYGAYLQNTTGTGNIAVTTGTFNLNVGSDGGLKVLSKGTITLTTVTASGNTGGSGASLDNSGASAAKSITIGGTNEFSSNKNNGLTVAATGAITASNITANYNGITGSNGSGALLTNTFGTAVVGVTLTGTNIFAGNYTTGMSIQSDGFVTLSNLIANSNSHGYGVLVLNSTAASAQPVTISGINQFKFNRDGGLVVYSKGLITASNITANSTGPSTANGAYLDNTGVGNTAGITITGVNVFNNNSWIGLNVHSYGPISVSNITANENGLIALTGYGVLLENTQDLTAPYVGITLSGTNFFDGNRDEGLRILSNGVITVNSITATNNQSNSSGVGVTLNNTDGGFTNSNSAITMTGTNVISNNKYIGLEITSYGVVTLNNVTATGNGNLGGFGTGVSINNSNASTPKNVSINGTNNISENEDNGLTVTTDGLITINSLTARYNGNDSGDKGADLSNNFPGNTAGITLTGTNVFSNNSGLGIQAQSRGPISMNNVTASGSVTSAGANILSTGGGTSSPQNVTLTGTNVFNSNYNSGLQISTYGAISVSNVTANGNGTSGFSGYGALLNNSSADPLLPLKGVTITGINQFNLNYDQGLSVNTRGAIIVSSLTANNNGLGSDPGVSLANNYASGAGPGVTVSGTNQFNGNVGIGLWITSSGLITLNNVTAIGNLSSHGLNVDNSTSGVMAPQNVTLTGINVFNNNFSSGVEIFTYGAISVNSITATGNGTSGIYGFGAYLYNGGTDNTLPRGITITGTNNFSDNFDQGLMVNSRGAISGSNITANNNGGGSDEGAYLDNSTAFSPMNVTLTGTNQFNTNSGTGLAIWTDGTVALSNITANGNGTGGSGSGIQVYNYYTAGKNVTLTGINSFSSNAGNGLLIYTSGAISVSSVTASSNISGLGADLDNSTYAPDTTPRTIALTGVNAFNTNGTTGLNVNSNGAISLSSVTANSNGTYGANLSNIASVLPQAITLSGFNTFNSNDQGLSIITKGAVTSSTGINASNNTASYGAQITNSAGDGTAVTLSGTNTFTVNQTNGLVIQSEGAITINAITATGNGIGASNGFGASLDNDNDPLKLSNITISGVNNFSGNYSGGLLATSRGAINLSSATASNTVAGTGVELNNEFSTSEGKTVTLGGTYVFNDNDTSGLIIISRGAITLNNITANGSNSSAGVSINNSAATAAQLVKLTGTSQFNGNGATGFAVTSHGAITTNNVTANENGSIGVYLNNDFASFTGGVTMTGINNFLANDSSGLWLVSNGVVALSNLTADGNGVSGSSDGLHISTDGNVTLTCGWIANNDDIGVSVTTLGTLTLKGVISSGNSGGDFSLTYGSYIPVRTC